MLLTNTKIHLLGKCSFTRAPQPQNNLEDEAKDGWGHWAMGNEQDNVEPM
jgi:hypothetical protein